MTIRRDEELTDDFSSPACSMHEADDAYMGFAPKQELARFLNELLEAQRAGARMTSQAVHAAGSGPMAEPLCNMQRDQARWCAMLRAHLQALRELASPEAGIGHDEAMSFPDLAERIVLLHRGQNQAMQKLRAMLPRVRDQPLHADLSAMLHSLEASNALVTDFTGRTR